MDEIISLVVANGLWAVLFCGLLVYELRDSRRREDNYTRTIRSLSDRLGVVSSVKADTEDIKDDAGSLLTAVKAVKSDTAAVKSAVVPRRAEKIARKNDGGAACPV
ncbi:MAG: BhlA/UviB family holin-like peptide [Roseburia sp.]|nr:BhlA/UviB family holin-like peptide [Roseburia sp.]